MELIKERKHKITLYDTNFKRLMKLRISNLEHPDMVIKRLLDSIDEGKELGCYQDLQTGEKVYQHVDYNIPKHAYPTSNI